MMEKLFRKKRKDRFELLQNMENIKDSMQFDSGTVIAKLHTKDGTYVKLHVVGDVCVNYNETGNTLLGWGTYRIPSQFPDKLKQIIADGKLWEDIPCLIVYENNWYELLLIFKNECCSCVVEADGFTAEDIEGMMREYARPKRKEVVA